MADQSKTDSSRHVLRADAITAAGRAFSHPWNPNSEVVGAMLGAALGLTRTGVNFITIRAGKEAYTPHAHQREEEWIYILSGRAMVLIGDAETEVGAGDFIAFPAPQVVHHVRNRGPEDLVCLMGGERPAYDAVDFPVQRKRLVRVGNDTRIYPIDADDPSGHPDAEASAAARRAR